MTTNIEQPLKSSKRRGHESSWILASTTRPPELHGLKRGIIKGINLDGEIKNFNCKICFRGKMTRKFFPKESDRKTSLLEIVHTDLCGPMRIQLNGKVRYFITHLLTIIPGGARFTSSSKRTMHSRSSRNSNFWWRNKRKRGLNICSRIMTPNTSTPISTTFWWKTELRDDSRLPAILNKTGSRREETGH